MLFHTAGAADVCVCVCVPLHGFLSASVFIIRLREALRGWDLGGVCVCVCVYHCGRQADGDGNE